MVHVARLAAALFGRGLLLILLLRGGVAFVGARAGEVAGQAEAGPDGFGGVHPGGCLFGMADGSVRFISDKVDPQAMEAIMTINGREVVDLDGLNRGR